MKNSEAIELNGITLNAVATAPHTYSTNFPTTEQAVIEGISIVSSVDAKCFVIFDGAVGVDKVNDNG